MNAPDTTSTRPYLIRALYEWCTDNGLTPYVAVSVDGSVQVPHEYVKNNEIVLNISFDATSSLSLGNDFIEFKARFAGSSRDIMVPIGRVIAIYARENGQGMAFPMGTEGNFSHVGAADGVTTPLAAVTTPMAVPSPTPSPVHGVQSFESKVVQLVPSNGSTSEPGRDADPPEPTMPPKGSRPSLTRVK